MTDFSSINQMLPFCSALIKRGRLNFVCRKEIANTGKFPQKIAQKLFNRQILGLSGKMRKLTKVKSIRFSLGFLLPGQVAG